MNMQGVYCIANTVSGTVYVGCSTNIKQRWRTHRCRLRNGVHGNAYLQSAWNKYGEDAFLWTIIEEVEKAVSLTDIEQHHLDKARRRGKVYNCGECAITPFLGQHHTVEARAKIGRAFKGRIFSEDHLAKISEARKGYKHSEEVKQRMRENQPDRSGSRNAFYGRRHT